MNSFDDDRDFIDDDHNPYRDDRDDRGYQRHQTTHPPRQPSSQLALVSFILGLFAPIAVCLCSFFGYIPILAGIVTGHMARSEIKRAAGAMSGTGLAITGLILNYGSMAFSIAMIAFVVLVGMNAKQDQLAQQQQAIVEGTEFQAPQARLQAAELKIISDTAGVAYGNSAKAIELARNMGDMMKDIRDEMFTEDKGGISISGGNFITYCELTESSCLFLIHVPNYRKFSADAKKSLAQLTWTAAQTTAAESIDGNHDLGVGMKGVILYGSVMVGKLSDKQPTTNDKERSHLVKFFHETTEAAELDPPLSEIPVDPIKPPEPKLDVNETNTDGAVDEEKSDDGS